MTGNLNMNHYMLYSLLCYLYSKMFYGFAKNYNTQSTFLQMLNMISMFTTLIVVYYVTHSDKKEMSPTLLIGMIFGFLSVLFVKYLKNEDTSKYTSNVTPRLAKLGGNIIYYVLLVVIIASHMQAHSSSDEIGGVQSYLGIVFALIIAIWFIYASLPTNLTVKKTIYDDDGNPILKDKESSYKLNIDTTYKYLLPLFLFMGNVNSPIIRLLNGVFLGGFIGSVNMFGYYYFIKEDIDVTVSDYNKCKNNNCQEIYESETTNNNSKTKNDSSETVNVVSIVIGIAMLLGIGGYVVKKSVMRGNNNDNNSFIS